MLLANGDSLKEIQEWLGHIMDFVCANESISVLLMDLKRYYDVGIVTNGLYDPRLKIQQMGVAEVFSDDSIFHSEQLGYRKPDPQIYTVALEKFGKKPMRRSLLVILGLTMSLIQWKLE
ncbi:hypothetical protein J23TS9_17500 [Paenibacillus sp. J23TS9]|uniref:HAD family hydrolase n=1 Tax=Paenibacillus sp. J23TS9 TaxID=2807193 RepID=UPI001B1CA83A|nr:HAD family hydrolase [Paenibacillus sp. J23TS9]GIP26620.1 hypothetical protein J23TS9_17500 [Paenibacillus sp. J23TS9]